MLDKRKIVIFVYPGCQLLDATGPASAFTTANAILGRKAYAVELVSAEGGIVETNSGIAVATAPMASVRRIDTLLVAGGEEAAIRAVLEIGAPVAWLARRARSVRRVGSVCSGAFLLAAAGLLNERRAATHWGACAALQRLYPSIRVDPQALFTVDGKFWTSAGVTTGLDMTLAMIEADIAAHVANDVAQTLVLYARRPGHQSQFSPLLKAQDKAGSTFGDLIRWMSEHLAERLDVPKLAARSRMSERTFYRRFTSNIGVPPAHFVETLRLDAARALLDSGDTQKSVAATTGFRSAAQMSLAFERRFGLRPTVMRELHARGSR